MCGIVAYSGGRQGVEEVLRGLERLEYRGYDSAGVAFAGSEQPGLAVVRSVGRVARLRDRLQNESVHEGGACIGHTRWATHGAPTESNAHPHVDCTGKLAVVHNGIIENYAQLKKELSAQGHVFRSATDTEVIAHLIEAQEGSLIERVRRAVGALRGTFAIAALNEQDDELVVARMGSPLIIGLADDETYVASDVSAIIARTRRVVYLDDGQMAHVCRGEVAVSDFNGNPKTFAETRIDWNDEAASKDGFAHYMRKEIEAQPASLRQALAGRFDAQGRATLPELAELIARSGTPKRILLTGCGTSYHAALASKSALAIASGALVDSEIASELRPEAFAGRAGDWLVVLSQSGETADTLIALRRAKASGMHVVGIVNVMGSTIAREADATIYTQAGPEISVASTKAFTTQLAVLSVLGAALGGRSAAHLASVSRVVEQTLKHEPEIIAWAETLAKSRAIMFLGRGAGVALAREGALKLMETSYLPSLAFPAGEMKHGPIALIDDSVSVVCIAVQRDTIDKTLSNCQEVLARGARTHLITLGAGHELDKAKILTLPTEDENSAVFAAAVVLQLLSYHVARILGCDIDKPRNLAKSVTVE